MQQTIQNIINTKRRVEYSGDLTTLDVFNAFRKLPANLYDLNAAQIRNANSFVAPTWQFLQPDSIAQIVNKFAPLKAYATVFDPDPMAPQLTSQTKFVSAGTTTLTGTLDSPITNYQSTGNTVDAVPVTVTHYSQPWSVSNPEAQKGARIEDGFVENALILADKVVSDLASNFKSANYPATAITPAGSAFALTDAARAFGTIKKGGKKSLILDGDYFALLTHQPGFDANTRYGWDNLLEQSAGWSSADANTKGIACAPGALVVVSGLLLPLKTALVKQQFLTLGELGLLIEFNRWFDPQTRTQWASLDLVAGGAPADSSAAVLIKSA